MGKSKRLRTALATAVAAASLMAVAPMADATSATGTARFDNGRTITANAWIQSFTWTGCGSFKSSAVINATPKWIKNTTQFYQIGLGSISVKGATVGVSGGSKPTLVWTNSNGSRGSYISGSVCGGWGALYVGMDVWAGALHYGNFRTAHAHI